MSPEVDQPIGPLIRNFSQSNPLGASQSDVPALLRRMATTIELLGDVECQDIVMHREVNENGEWPSFTVYFHDREPSE